jgi:eukaryotic-like serine/threonine-protein kinase
MPTSDLSSDLTVPVGAFGVGARVADRYEILGLLGAGGMGAVYRARDLELDEDIALKVLTSSGDSEDARIRFRREVKLARRVTHPNVARTYDLGEHQGHRYLTMELIEGKSLRDAAQGRLPLPETLRIVTEVARGLSVAHAAGVVHCDLKPDNVLLTETRVVITDFGIARSAGLSDALKTSGAIVGTPAYMAPEQVEGREVDGRADVFALAVMLYELVTGELPFAGESPFALAAARLVRDAPDLRQRAPNVPEGIARLVAAGLARARDERVDAQAFLEALSRARGGEAEVRGSGVGAAPAPTPTGLWTSGIVRGSGKNVYVAPVSGEPRSMAGDLDAAIHDALAKERRITVVAAPPADFTLETSLRAVDGRVRVRAALRAGQGEALWSERIDGTVADPFALEDALGVAVARVVEQRLLPAGGPATPALRGIYDEANAVFERLELTPLHGALATLDALSEADRADPWIITLRARLRMRIWLIQGAFESDAPIVAEELLLRALDRDPTIAEAYHALGSLRLAAGDYQAARRAFEEALRRAPTLAISHVQLGMLAAETGHLAQGLRSLDVAMRLQPENASGALERLRLIALTEPRAAAEAEVLRVRETFGPFASLSLEVRLPFWWRDRALAGAVATQVESHKSGASWEYAAPFLRDYETGPRPEWVASSYAGVAKMPIIPRRRTLLLMVAAEHLAAIGSVDEAFVHMQAAADAALVDVLWLDRCPALDEIRDDPRFGRIRAAVALRAAAVWS